MEYSIFITKNILDCLKYYFDVDPFLMQAAFAIAEINERPECVTILLSEFTTLNETDYESQSHNFISFYSKSLLNILHKTSYQNKHSLIYIHSHNLFDYHNFENDDQKMIFRISYAYIPFGIHVSLFYTHGELSGKVWLPTLTTEPLNIIHE